MGGGLDYEEGRVAMTDGDAPWSPLWVRERGDESSWHVLQPGVPAHLQPGLRRAVAVALGKLPGSAEVVQRRLRLELVAGSPAADGLLWATDEQPDLLLAIADCLLAIACEDYRTSQRSGIGYEQQRRLKERSGEAVVFIGALMRMLQEADSIYEVKMPEAPEVWHLATRVDATATAAVLDAHQSGRDSGRLLATAWRATFQHQPDLARAYGDAVLAAEAAACPVLIPKDPAPTLGKAISHLAATVSGWTVAGLDDKQQQSAETLLSMLRTLWQNQERHAARGGKAPQAVDQAEAEVVLFLATTLVQWFDRGLVRRSDVALGPDK